MNSRNILKEWHAFKTDQREGWRIRAKMGPLRVQQMDFYLFRRAQRSWKKHRRKQYK